MKAAWSVCLLISCSSPQPPQTPQRTEIRTLVAGMEHTAWRDETVYGISGLTRDLAGTYWTVPERNPVLIPFILDGAAKRTKEVLPIKGVPPGLDLEAVAWMDEKTIAFGTESDADRASDLILLARVEEEEVVVTSQIIFPYAPWSLKPERNRGIEGLCYSAGRLIVASEMVLTEQQKRYAPLGVYDFLTKQWTPLRLLLTSEKGKISGLTCTQNVATKKLEVIAIERHFGIARLLKLSLPLMTKPGDVKPVTTYDAAQHFPKEIPNLEGIALHDRTSVVLISDNHYGEVSGPTHIVRLFWEPIQGQTGGNFGSFVH